MLSLDPHQPSPDRQTAQRVFAIFCATHLLVWTLVPALMYECVPGDTLEGISWGNMWLLGYDKHPPLAPWLSALFTSLFGVVGWPIYLASQLSVVLCFWAVWSLASDMLPAWKALVAVVLLEGIHYYNVSSFTFNPNIVLLSVWAMLVLSNYRAIRSPTIGRWLHAGFWAGLAVLAKYESAILFLTLLIVILVTKEGRESLKRPGFYLGILIATLIASPHIAWLLNSDLLAVHYALGGADAGVNSALEPVASTHWQSVKGFVVGQIGALLPAALLFLIVWGRRPQVDWSNFNHKFIVLTLLLPPVLIVIAALVTQVQMVVRWGYPMFSLSGIALCLFFKPEFSSRRIKLLFVAVLLLTMVLVCGIGWLRYYRPYQTGKPYFTTTFPAKTLAEHVTGHWRSRYGSSLKYVAGDRWRVAGISAYSADKPAPYFDWNPRANPWINESDLLRHGAVFVHQLRGEPDAQDQKLFDTLRTRFPALNSEEQIELPELTNAPLRPIRFWLAYLPPAGMDSQR